VEEVEAVVLRSVKELILLFPNRKITTNDIYEWCGGINSKKAIRRILVKTFELIRHSRSSYYSLID
jgi:hypothetical protein